MNASSKGELLTVNAPSHRTRAQATQRPFLIILWTLASLGTLLFVSTLILAKLNFNPSDWIPNYVAKGRIHFLPKWSLELYSCRDRSFSHENCESISGRFAFQDLKLPLDPQDLSRMTALAERSTHIEMRTTLTPELEKWILERNSEEFLRPALLLIRNGRCFQALGDNFCSARTEHFEVKSYLKTSKLIEVQFPISQSVRLGPQIIPPMMIEANLIDVFMSLESKISAAFWSEFTLMTGMTFFLGLLALLFPWHAPTVVLLALAFTRSLWTVISYGVENQGWNLLLRILGTHGYLALSMILNSLILGLVLYLCFTLMKGVFKPSRFEIFYALALMLLFFGVAFSYGELGSLSNASLFARDTIATLFGSIWIIYFLIHEWQHDTDQNFKSNHSSLAAFVFLFFLVAYGAHAAQTALRQSMIPDLLPWQSLFFIPGVALASFIHLKRQLKDRRELEPQENSNS